MDALAMAAASSDDVAPQSPSKKMPPESESESESEASGDVKENSEVKVEDTQHTKIIIEEGDDRKCSYSDFSQVPPKSINPSTRNKEPTFPMKLHMILSNPAFQHIISWLPHGRSWRILQQKAFEQRVIPLFFRHGRYSSFARQVNGWGFSRISHGPDFGSYYHEVRGSRGPWSSFFFVCSSGLGILLKFKIVLNVRV
jgi:HSF-type DNA-binding